MVILNKQSHLWAFFPFFVSHLWAVKKFGRMTTPVKNNPIFYKIINEYSLRYFDGVQLQIFKSSKFYGIFQKTVRNVGIEDLY